MLSNNNISTKINSPVFFGLSHLGQVFSLCWSKKIGKCYVFDNDKKMLNSFKRKNYTLEEPDLRKLKLDKVEFLEKFEEIKNYKYIFFTFDTPLNIKDGKPKLDYIYRNLKKILNLKFQSKTYLIISSQINPKIIRDLKKDLIKNKNIKIFYFVDTLKMGEALDKFLNPNQIIIGGEKKEKKNIFKLFKKFKSKKFYLSIDEAIILKMAINIYLSFSVTFANIIDDLCRQYSSNYSEIIQSLKNDNRIGQKAYINPSLGFAGGHLERDLFYLNEITRNKTIKKLIKNILSFNNKAINKIEKKISFDKKSLVKTLIIGKSYKKNSFSEVNSSFSKMNKRFKLSYFDDVFFRYDNPKKRLKELIKKTDLIIYNYSSKKIRSIILDLTKKLNKKLINLNEEKINSKNEQNHINLF